MNILHMKYALEVAKQGSLNKAADILLIAAPNISRSIKELEADLGITIFSRSAKGMVLTAEGEEFITYAKRILDQIDELDRLYCSGARKKQKFSVAVPQSEYITDAFVEFSNSIDGESAEIFYKETSCQKAISSVMSGVCKLAIVRYPCSQDAAFRTMAQEKELSYELLEEFTHRILVGEGSPIAQKSEVNYADISELIEITNNDFGSTLTAGARPTREYLGIDMQRRIFVRSHACAIRLLQNNPATFTWAPTTPKVLLDKYGLVEKVCVDEKKTFRDVLIYKDGYKLSKLDNCFVNALCASKRRYFRADK